jgi:glycosyltransferase involved in cell wall biosynthesis
MEDRNGWQRALQAAEDFVVTVACGPETNVEELQARVPERLTGRLRFISVDAGTFGNYCLRREGWFYLGYRLWHLQVAKLARQLHGNSPFAATYMATICGYREPGDTWKLNCPFFWGPVGGASNFPLAYLSVLSPSSALYELLRNTINSLQLRFSWRVHQAARQAVMVFAANQSAKQLISRGRALDVKVELEAGIDFAIGRFGEDDAVEHPLRILWVGRLRAWKGLPLLLHALSRLKDKNSFELRVIGDGSCKAAWKRMAEKLRIADRICWESRGPYRESLRHYQWADVFAFTSLRDTSGTGLLESLAAGVPIVGLNHQGAADIIDNHCGIPIPVSTPKASIHAFERAFSDLAADRTLLLRLRQGALKRAHKYHWDSRVPLMRQFGLQASHSNSTDIDASEFESQMV